MISVRALIFGSSFFLVVTMAALPLPVFAQSGGYYLELGAGSSEARSEPLPPLTSGSQVSQSTARSASYTLTGGWRFNDNFSVEISYTDHGSFSDRAVLSDHLIVMEPDPAGDERIPNQVDARLEADVDYDLQSYGVSLLGVWPMSRRWSAYGRIGLMSWEAESKIKGRMTYRGDLNQNWSVDGKFSDSNTSFVYGLGLFYRINRNYAARLEYQHMSVESGMFNGDPKLGSLGFGIRYYF